MRPLPAILLTRIVLDSASNNVELWTPCFDNSRDKTATWFAVHRCTHTSSPIRALAYSLADALSKEV